MKNTRAVVRIRENSARDLVLYIALAWVAFWILLQSMRSVEGRRQLPEMSLTVQLIVVCVFVALCVPTLARSAGVRGAVAAESEFGELRLWVPWSVGNGASTELSVSSGRQLTLGVEVQEARFWARQPRLTWITVSVAPGTSPHKFEFSGPLRELSVEGLVEVARHAGVDVVFEGRAAFIQGAPRR